MTQLSLGIGVVGIIATGLLQGVRSGVGFALGAGVSYVNFLLIQRMVNAIGTQGLESAFRSILMGMRYVLLAGLVYVIVEVLDITHVAVIEGLFVSIAAVLLELLYEIVNPHRF
jgi:ATP synthase I chain